VGDSLTHEEVKTVEKRSKADEALRRYVMIDPFLRAELEHGEKSALLQDISATYGVSASTLKRYLIRYGAGGPEGLRRRKRADSGKVRRLPEAALNRAVQLRTELPTRSTPLIIRMLEHERSEWQGIIKRSTLDDHFRNMGLNRRVLCQDSTPRRRFAKTRRNALWQTDICKPQVWVQENGRLKQAIVVAIIDDATRFCVGAEFFLSEEVWVVETTLRKAIARYGAPNALYLDNGAQFCAHQISEACKRLLIQHRRAAVGDPAGKGKVERHFRTLQESFVPELSARTAPPTLAELNRLFWAWVDHHYHQSIHRELETTPAKRWAEDSTPLRRIDPVTLDSAFLISVERRVDKTNLISLHNRRYLVEKVRPRTKVEVRYHPQESGQVQIWLKDEFVQIAFPYLTPTHSTRARENKPIPTPKPTTSYLDQLDAEHQQLMAQQRDAICSRPPARQPDVFKEINFLQMLAEMLNCALKTSEDSVARSTWRTCGGLDQHITRAALERAIAQWGRSRHVTVYLEAIYQAHQAKIPSEVIHHV